VCVCGLELGLCRLQQQRQGFRWSDVQTSKAESRMRLRKSGLVGTESVVLMRLHESTDNNNNTERIVAACADLRLKLYTGTDAAPRVNDVWASHI